MIQRRSFLFERDLLLGADLLTFVKLASGDFNQTKLLKSSTVQILWYFVWDIRMEICNSSKHLSDSWIMLTTPRHVKGNSFKWFGRKNIQFQMCRLAQRPERGQNNNNCPIRKGLGNYFLDFVQDGGPKTSVTQPKCLGLSTVFL